MELQLARYRKAKGYTQAELGKAVHVSPRVVSSWERGEAGIGLADAVNVADFLGVTLDELARRDFVVKKRSMGVLSSEENEIVVLFRACTPQWQRQIAMSARSAAVASKEGSERGLSPLAAARTA